MHFTLLDTGTRRHNFYIWAFGKTVVQITTNQTSTWYKFNLIWPYHTCVAWSALYTGKQSKWSVFQPAKLVNNCLQVFVQSWNFVDQWQLLLAVDSNRTLLTVLCTSREHGRPKFLGRRSSYMEQCLLRCKHLNCSLCRLIHLMTVNSDWLQPAVHLLYVVSSLCCV